MLHDLTQMLRDWPYEENSTVRLLTTIDGREIMQLRLPLGVEQFELDGRPDGISPESAETVLDLYLKRLEEREAEAKPFALNDEDFGRLRGEAILYYRRYLILFQLGEYRRASLDTGHNLAICDLVENYYQGDDKIELLQYRPYILRVNTISLSMQDLNLGFPEAARERLEKTVEMVKNMPVVASPVFEFERMRALQHLNTILEQIRERSLSKRDLLERELADAVEREEYERAARIRDQLNE